MPPKGRPLKLPIAGRVERSDAAANRRRILVAARKLLDDGGPDALTMDAVAAAAGVGKGTIFRRFGDRAGLLHALLDEHTRVLQDRFLQGPPPLGPGAPPGERLVTFVVEVLRLHSGHLSLAVIAEMAAHQPRPGALEALHLHAASLIAPLAPNADAHVLAAMVLAAAGPVAVAVARRRGISNKELERCARVLLAGIVPGTV